MTRKAATMPTTDPMPTREDLERQAAEVGAQLDALRQQDAREEQERQQRRAQAEREFDQQQAANYSRRELDAEVTQARAAFDSALADTPLVRTLANYMTALQRRRNSVYAHLDRLNRLGATRAARTTRPLNSVRSRTSSPPPCSGSSPRAPTPTRRRPPRTVRPQSPPQPKRRSPDDHCCHVRAR